MCQVHIPGYLPAENKFATNSRTFLTKALSAFKMFLPKQVISARYPLCFTLHNITSAQRQKFAFTLSFNHYSRNFKKSST